MRLIDADALEEEIRAKDIMGGLNYSLFIRNAPTIEMRRPDKWIPVSESIQEKQANADKIDAVYIDGFKAGYSQARFDLEQQPCDDAISRQAVCNIVNDIRDCISVEGYCAIIERLKKLPPVTPKSETVTEFADRCRECGKMRKGHWIWNFDKGYCKCSECGIGMGHKEFDYCPNCGCRMVEPQESEDEG